MERVAQAFWHSPSWMTPARSSPAPQISFFFHPPVFHSSSSLYTMAIFPLHTTSLLLVSSSSKYHCQHAARMCPISTSIQHGHQPLRRAVDTPETGGTTAQRNPFSAAVSRPGKGLAVPSRSGLLLAAIGRQSDTLHASEWV